jgi:hypothetical protein
MLARFDCTATMPLISKGIYMVLLRGSANLSSFKGSNSNDLRTDDIDWLISPLFQDDVVSNRTQKHVHSYLTS